MKTIKNGLSDKKYIDDIINPIDTYIDYYDLAMDTHILDRQIKIAKSYGINGFMFYHYWFSKTKSGNHRVMYKPLERMLEKDRDFNFILNWVNGEWEDDKKCKITNQCYNDENESEQHIYYLLQFFTHKKYLKDFQRIYSTLCILSPLLSSYTKYLKRNNKLIS